MPEFYIALVHYPVYNRQRQIVSTSVTNLDIHDLARTGRTYAAAGVFLVTPIVLQRQLIQEVFNHWTQGEGLQVNPWRSAAIERVRVADRLDTVIETLTRECGQPPLIVATSAVDDGKSISYDEMRNTMSRSSQPVLLVFGTGWGLAQELMERCSHRLCPIFGRDGYNHLPVRAAVAIILDRLFAPDQDNRMNNDEGLDGSLRGR